jgi:hypothetical protein
MGAAESACRELAREGSIEEEERKVGAAEDLEISEVLRIKLTPEEMTGTCQKASPDQKGIKVPVPTAERSTSEPVAEPLMGKPKGIIIIGGSKSKGALVSNASKPEADPFFYSEHNRWMSENWEANQRRRRKRRKMMMRLLPVVRSQRLRTMKTQRMIFTESFGDWRAR